MSHLQKPLRVVTYNVHSCVGTDGCFAPERIVSLIADLDADVVALQEVEDSQCGVTTVVPFLAESLNMRIAGRTSHLRHGLDYGNLLLTKVEPREVQPLDLAVPGREPRAATAADIELHGVRVRVFATHFGLSLRERYRQVSTLVGRLASSDADLTILCADFNEWLPYSAVHGVLRQTLGRSVKRRTFPSRFPMLSLDRVYAAPQDAIVAVTAVNNAQTRLASDHLPVVADFELAHIP